MAVLYFQILLSTVLLVFAGIPVWRRIRESESGLSSSSSRVQLQGNDRRYREIFENGTDGIFVVEVLGPGKFRFESLNPAAAEILSPQGLELAGCAFDKFSGRCRTPLSGFIEELQQSLSLSLAGGLPTKYEYFMDHPGEDGLYLQVKLVPMADDCGIGHVHVFLHDITARKRYEQELLQRIELEERLSGFAASAPGFFFTYRHGEDGTNSMPFASAGIDDLFGLRPENVALSIAPINLLIHPDDQKEFIDAIVRSAVALTPFDVEFRVNHPKRGELWVGARATPQEHGDRSIVWHGFMYDITGRKQVETDLLESRKNLEEAQRIGKMGSWELDLAGGKLYWSDEIYRIFEIDRDRFGASYEAFLNTVHPEDRAAVDMAYQDSLASGQSYSIDHRLRFPDGRIKHVRESCETIYGEGGRPLRSRGTVQDITQLKDAELKLIEMQRKLRELIQARQEVLELERKRIAWEMNEELAQQLFAIKMRLFGLRSRVVGAVPAIDADMRGISDMADKAVKTVTDLVASVRPTVLMHGVGAALEWLTTEIGERHGIPFDLGIDEGEMLHDEEQTTQVFRVAQEILEGIVRNEQVGNIVVVWSSVDEMPCLRIEYETANIHAGNIQSSKMDWFGVRERVAAFGGELREQTANDGCSRIEVRFPAGDLGASQRPLFSA